MATLDQATWLDGTGTAQDGTTVVTDGANSTTVTADFTGSWVTDDPGGSGNDINSNFATGENTADFSFSNDVTNLSFSLDAVNASGSFNDGYRVLILDENGQPIPLSSITITQSSGGTINISQDANGNILIDPDTGIPNGLTFSTAGPVSQVIITSTPAPDGSTTGGSGISDFTFDVPPPPPCFARGTLIETLTGPVAVEDLRVGDLVLTKDNGEQPIRWVGGRHVPGSGNRAPIVFRAGTIGNDRDLVVSQNHRVLLTGWKAEMLFGEAECLVAAKSLVNDETIRLQPCEQVQYFHILFDRHEIVYSNGAATESFLPGNVGLNSLDKGLRAEILDLFPELEAQNNTPYPPARPLLNSREARALASF